MSAPADTQPMAPALAPADTPAEAQTGGVLEVHSDDLGARVLLDGEDVGEVPLHLEGVAPGAHQVQVVRDGREPVLRSIEMRPGLMIQLELSSPAPPMGLEPIALQPVSAPSAPNPWIQVLKAVGDLPWVGLAVGATFGLLLAGVLFFTSSPGDVPLLANNNISITGNMWTGFGYVAVIAAIAPGLIAAVLLLARSDVTSRLTDAITSIGKDKDPAAGQ